ncbi:hypothetical protein CFP71_39900 [Amycolatopsis thailandensis]|uniref:Twin-arginine translocation pathway signal n=1 Tax=Amycolatopsis thailandensis TaxID=589330 RepID=A0A229RDB3_9PSEU|nr:hypothetical protein [Amycolatopsis thailandensis]OXM44673.1 hypothetical protein CFP71_39900 [Amycolatopsis thailandensis]
MTTKRKPVRRAVKVAGKMGGSTRVLEPPEEEVPEAPEAPVVSSAPEVVAPVKRRRGIVVFGAVAVVMAGLAGWFAVEARDATSVLAHNTALTDVATTAEVSDQIGKALGTVFSYRYDDPAKSEQAAKEVLTGPALGQYDQLFAQVRGLAAEQKLVVTSTPVVSGVKVLDGDRASLLVFLDQTGVRGDGQRSTGAAQLSVSAERSDGRWRVTALAAA